MNQSPCLLADSTSRVTISNDIMAVVPHHAFFERLVQSLPARNVNWILPYFNVMNQVGLDAVAFTWADYIKLPASKLPDEIVRVLVPDDNKVEGLWRNEFFDAVACRTWWRWDAAVICFEQKYLALATLVNLGMLFLISMALWACVWNIAVLVVSLLRLEGVGY
jgi:mannosyltransferase OCH1-like enzyme